MPFKPKTVNPNHTVNLTIPIPGHLKNQLIHTAETAGESLQQHINRILTNHIRNQHGKPELTDQQHDPLQPVIDYLNGKTTLNPCGKTDCTPIPVQFDGKPFCDICGIGLSGSRWDRWDSNPQLSD